MFRGRQLQSGEEVAIKYFDKKRMRLRVPGAFFGGRDPVTQELSFLSEWKGKECPFMIKFVESFEDLAEILKFLPNAQIVSKIESLKGMEFISQYNVPNLMAARDDLYIESGQNFSMLKHLKTIIERDSGAICASKIFLSLERRGRETPDLADFSDLELMYNMGYRRFMLCDNICNFCLSQATKAWEEFING